MIVGNQVYQKAANQALVLKTIREAQNASRIDITHKLGLKKSSVSNLVAELIENQIIEEITEGSSTPQGGRKPVLLGLRNEFACVAGVDFQNNHYRIVIVDMAGNIITSQQKILDHYIDFPTHIEEIRQAVDLLVEPLGIPLIGIGIGIPGCVDVKHGIVIESWAHNLNNYDFVKELLDSKKVPLLLDNDSNCCAWGELWNQRGDGGKNFVYLLAKFNNSKKKESSGQGIGLGLVLNGRVFYGSQFGAGEIKSFDWKNSREEQLGLSYDDYMKVPENPAILRSYLQEILMNLSVVVSVLNPSEIYVGGDLTEYFTLISSILAEDLKTSWIAKPQNGCRLVYPTMGNEEIALGAARNFLIKLFSVPRLGQKDHYLDLNWREVFETLKQLNQK